MQHDVGHDVTFVLHGSPMTNGRLWYRGGRGALVYWSSTTTAMKTSLTSFHALIVLGAICSIVAADEVAPPLPPADQLAAQLSDDDLAARRKALFPIVRLSALAAEYRPLLRAALDDKDEDVRMYAALGLAATGQRDEQVTAEIIRGLSKVNLSYLPGPEYQAQHALIVQGRASVPILIAALKQKNLSAQFRALDALQQIGPEAKNALPAIAEALRAPHESLHSQLLFAKWRIDGDSEFAIARLVPLLEIERERMCGGAVDCLWKMGPEAKGAVPALIAAMHKHKDHGVVHALDELCTWFAPEILPAMREALTETELVDDAVFVLGKHCQDKEFLIPYLVKMINEDPDPLIHPSDIATVLGSFGSRSKAAVPGLIRTLKNPSGHARIMAAEALGKIGPDAEAALPALTAALEDKDSSEAATRAMVLIRTGTER